MSFQYNPKLKKRPKFLLNCKTSLTKKVYLKHILAKIPTKIFKVKL